MNGLGGRRQNRLCPRVREALGTPLDVCDLLFLHIILYSQELKNHDILHFKFSAHVGAMGPSSTKCTNFASRSTSSS